MDSEFESLNERSPDSDYTLSPSPSPSSTKTSSQSSDSTDSYDSRHITLPPPANKSQLSFPSFSKLFRRVRAAKSTTSSNPLNKDVRVQGEVGVSHEEALATVTAKASQPHKLQSKVTNPSIDVPQKESSIRSGSLVLREENPSLPSIDNIQKQNGNNPSDHVSENPNYSALSVQLLKEKVDKQGNTWLSIEQSDYIPKTANSDGYGWRKYGQKKVKNSGSSKSYYRCTHLNCSAKKNVQHLDGSGRVIAVVYKGDHNHDPPQNLKGFGRKYGKDVEVTVVPLIIHKCQDSVSERNCSEDPVSTSDPIQRLESETATLPPKTVHCNSVESNEIGMSDPVKEYGIVPLKKRRIKEGSQACSVSVYRTIKEPKVILHVESSSDGYRWRKYGQKMVKGHSNPRSYYRCTSAGCPVRKHVEKATDDPTTVVVTYEGRHDHDKPVPRNCYGPPSSPPVATTTTLVHRLEFKSPAVSKEPSAQGSRDDSNLGEDEAIETSSDKVLESARTLLSIGI